MKEHPWQVSSEGRSYRLIEGTDDLFWCEERGKPAKNGAERIFVDIGIFKKREDAERRLDALLNDDALDITGYLQHVVQMRTN